MKTEMSYFLIWRKMRSRHFFVKLTQVHTAERHFKEETAVDFHMIDSIWTADSTLPIKT